jgi:peptidoglycan/LPS O-acetylase OafA/YrhL
MLRAVAFFMVFLAHGLLGRISSPGQPGAIARAGEFGVCVFFFLSSYLITELLLREKGTGSVAVGRFYMRRVLRIWPLYFAMVAANWLLGLVSATHAVSPTWLLALTLFWSNWYTLHHGYPPGFLFPLWSIALEEQFYLVWPWLMKYLQPKSILALACVLAVASYGGMAFLLARGASLDPGLWANSIVQFQFFALGTATAVLLHGRALQRIRIHWTILFFAGLLCLRGAQGAVWVNHPSAPHGFAQIAPRFLLADAGCLCLFFSLFPMRGGRLQQPLMYLGKVSYGLYVFHIVWIELFQHILRRFQGGMAGFPFELCVMALALPATIVTAVVSYRFLESPFLRYKKQFTTVSSRPV